MTKGGLPTAARPALAPATIPCAAASSYPVVPGGGWRGWVGRGLVDGLVEIRGSVRRGLEDGECGLEGIRAWVRRRLERVLKECVWGYAYA